MVQKIEQLRRLAQDVARSGPRNEGQAALKLMLRYIQNARQSDEVRH